jgi:predicted aminopeptidase
VYLTNNYYLSLLKIKRFVEIALIALFVLITFNFRLIGYGLSQLNGQLRIVFHAKPIPAMLADSAVADSVKNKLLVIDEIKKFAVDSLGLKQTKNYTTYYDQHGKALLMVLSASEKFALKAYQWKFPFLGMVSYKGFFNFKKGEKEKQELNSMGYDTDYGPTGAWSTLGWFRDPVFSGMLRRNEGQLAELIIHEMTHGTLYLKNSVDFNENLASAIGEEGVERFLKYKFGSPSAELTNYLDGKDDYDRYSAHILRGATALDSLYHSFDELKKNNAEDSILKLNEKRKLILQIVSALDTVTFHHPEKYHALFSENRLPNNAYFMNFKRYDAQKDEMKKQLHEIFNADIKKYLDFLKKEPVK